MARILITGGLGYIGSHTALELLRSNFEIVIIDNLSNSSLDILKRLEKISNKKINCKILDLTDTEKLRDFFVENNNFDAIIHFAAFKAVGQSVKEPVKYYRNNINSLLNILDNAEAFGIKNIVFSSSCTVYGEPDVLPVAEDSPIKPATSPYGYTKQVCENLLRDCSAVSIINCIALRYFNPIGADESGELGEVTQGEPANLMPYITQTAMGVRQYLSVFGNAYNTPDGTCIRDYIHITDLAKAHVKAVERLVMQTQNKFEVFNIGTGCGYSVLDVINSFERSTGVKVPFKFAPKRDGDIERIWCNPTFANKVLNWKSEKILDEMTASAWKWENLFKNND
jgi:UDP-glucose 4-epimerase